MHLQIFSAKQSIYLSSFLNWTALHVSKAVWLKHAIVGPGKEEYFQYSVLPTSLLGSIIIVIPFATDRVGNQLSMSEIFSQML